MVLATDTEMVGITVAKAVEAAEVEVEVEEEDEDDEDEDGAPTDEQVEHVIGLANAKTLALAATAVWNVVSSRMVFRVGARELGVAPGRGEREVVTTRTAGLPTRAWLTTFAAETVVANWFVNVCTNCCCSVLSSIVCLPNVKVRAGATTAGPAGVELVAVAKALVRSAVG